MTRTVSRPVLERAAQEVCDATSEPPFIFQLPPTEGRQVLEDLQSDIGVPKPPIIEEWITIEGGPSGHLPVRIVKPEGARGVMPVVIYIHGAGWVFGSAHTHDRLVRELAVRSGAAVVFPEYDRSPEAKYPTAIEQCYATAQWVVEHGLEKELDAGRVAVCGDSVGGNMSIAVTLMAMDRGGPDLRCQALLYPVTNAVFDTESYDEFAERYFLYREGMKWFWDQYTTDPNDRAEITASPLRADLGQLRGLPPALVITEEADVLRDEGEAYAAKLRLAGVPVTQVRFQGMIHDFMMLDALRDTNANRAALALTGRVLEAALYP